jgi:hypothetical protein
LGAWEPNEEKVEDGAEVEVEDAAEDEVEDEAGDEVEEAASIDAPPRSSVFMRAGLSRGGTMHSSQDVEFLPMQVHGTARNQLDSSMWH